MYFMYFLYLVISLALLFFAKKKYKKRVNPVSTYIFPWLGMITLYILNLVYYNQVSIVTWITVILFQLVFCLCTIIGSNTVFVTRHKTDGDIVDRNTLTWMILWLTLISSVGVIPNFINFVKKYSLSFMNDLNLVYQNRLSGKTGYEIIPYVGTLVFLAVLYAGVYFRRFGFNKILIIPLVMCLLVTFPGGGRSGILLEFFMFFGPKMLYSQKKNSPNIIEKRRFNIKTKLFFIIIAAILIYLFFKMSSVRSSWITINQYMSPTMVALLKISPVFYKTYTYITEPLVALSEFLKDISFSFGLNTFGMFINILNKLGFNLYYERYQSTYYVPMACNVASYIRELIQDFTYPGGIFATALFSFLYGVSFSQSQKQDNIYSEAMSSLLLTVTVLSFFVFFYRESVFWIVTIVMPITVRLMRKKGNRRRRI